MAFRVPKHALGSLVTAVPVFVRDMLVVIMFVVAISYMISSGYSPSIYMKF